MGRVPENQTQPEGFLVTRTRNKLKIRFENPTQTLTQHLATRPITKFLHINIFFIIFEFLDL